MSDLAAIRERIDQRAQRPLLPLGDPGPSHRWVSRRRGKTVRITAYLLAVLSTVVGLALTLTPASAAVAMSGDSYRIGDTTLHATAPGRYAGDGALIVSAPADGVQRAAGDAVVNGQHQSGVCFLAAAQQHERCVFSVGATSVSAVDTWTGSGWQRRYDDGQQVSIPANTMAPVPFAVAR